MASHLPPGIFLQRGGYRGVGGIKFVREDCHEKEIIAYTTQGSFIHMVQAKFEKINKTGTMTPDILLNISCQNVILSMSLLHPKYEPTKIVKAKVNCLPNEMQVKD